MKWLYLYWPAIAHERAFVNSYGDNENLQELARRLWNELDSFAPSLWVGALLIAFLFCWYYYIPYNNKPDRHYRVSKWGWMMLLCFLWVLLLTLALEYLCIETQINGRGMTFFFISLQNGLWAAVFYFVFSVVACNVLPTNWTNAYRLFQL